MIGSCSCITRVYETNHINLRALEDGRQPDDIDAQLLEVVDLGNDTLQIARSRPRRVLEGGRPYLVYGSLLPASPSLLGRQIVDLMR